MEALHAVGDKDHTYILDMRHVPTMDATGLVALESVLDRLHRSKIKVIFAGLAPEVSEMFDRAGIKRELGQDRVRARRRDRDQHGDRPRRTNRSRVANHLW